MQEKQRVTNTVVLYSILPQSGEMKFNAGNIMWKRTNFDTSDKNVWNPLHREWAWKKTLLSEALR